MQEASSRQSWNPASLIFMTTIAFPGMLVPVSSPGRDTSTELTLPTLAPATRTSMPDTTKAPLSKTALTW